MSFSITRNAVRATGGTQASEYAAAIKSVTSSITVGAVFLYSTKDDSDGGAWRKKCKGLSWFDEGSSTTRSARSEFPAMALIVADNAATPTVTIYDLDDPAMPMWMVFSSEASGDSNHFWRYGDATSIAALNGRIIVGKTTAGGSTEIRLVEDKTWNNGSSGTNQMLGGIVDRNSGLGWGTVNTSRTTVNNQHNDVAMTVLEGAEIGELGLPIPTVAVATDGGVSVIHANGDVYNQTKTVSSNVNSFDVAWGETGDLYWSSRTISGVGTYLLYLQNTLYATSSASPNAQYDPTGTGGGNKVIFLGTGSPYINGFTPIDKGVAIGSSQGLSIIKDNKSNPDEGMVSYHTSIYATGYMVGDIRGAWLANSLTADRSVKANAIVATGSPSLYTVATGAELQGVDLDGSTQYLTQAYNADLNYGTGDFAYYGWMRQDTTHTGYIFDRSDTDGTNRRAIYVASDDFVVYDSSGALMTGGTTITDDVWYFVCHTRVGGKSYLYVNGKLDVAGVTDAFDLTSSDNSATLSLGVRYVVGETLNGKLALWRTTATGMTPKQIADIYAAEKPLFAANAKCLLQSDVNTVNDLAYDKATSLLTVAQTSNTSEGGIQRFRGLELVEQVDPTDSGWSYVSTAMVASSGGVSAYGRTSGGGGLILDLPAIDVRADLNEGATTLPDDGKLHFEGVTTDATATSIGTIQVGINERYTVTATIVGEEYNVDSGNWISVTTTRTYQRDLGSLGYQPVSYKLSDESLASMDAVLTADANNILVWVTGVSGKQIVWKASVEVQRISDKTYER